MAALDAPDTKIQRRGIRRGSPTERTPGQSSQESGIDREVEEFDAVADRREDFSGFERWPGKCGCGVRSCDQASLLRSRRASVSGPRIACHRGLGRRSITSLTCFVHKHPNVRRWLERHRRWTFHFTPTSASWLNAVEGFFATLTKRRLKRGVFRSVVDLQAAINRFLEEHNQQSQPFTWTADPDKIIAAVRRGHQVLDSIH
jgi:transposase